MRKLNRKNLECFFSVIHDDETKETSISIQNFGDFRLGLTGEEIDLYLKGRAILKPVCKRGRRSPLTFPELKKKFLDIAGVNTCAVVQGKTLMYRHDVERYADVLFKGKPTYFD